MVVEQFIIDMFSHNLGLLCHNSLLIHNVVELARCKRADLVFCEVTLDCETLFLSLLLDELLPFLIQSVETFLFKLLEFVSNLYFHKVGTCSTFYIKVMTLANVCIMIVLKSCSRTVLRLSVCMHALWALTIYWFLIESRMVLVLLIL